MNKFIYFRLSSMIIFVVTIVLFNSFLFAQKKDTVSAKFTLSQCLTYALANQPLIKQSLLDEDIVKRDIRIGLSGWYPQLGFNASLEHYIKLPVALFQLTPTGPLQPLTTEPYNVSGGTFYFNQTLYSNSLMFAARTSRELRNQASQNTENSKINIYVDVTKAFFDVLLTHEGLNVVNEDILRLQRNYKDAYNLYKNGLTDKIDYQRTTISLSNALAQKKYTQEALKGKLALLKQLMGVVPEKYITILYDSSKYEKDIFLDTMKVMDYKNRIEYQLQETTMKLQKTEISYFKWSFLPTLSGYYNYSPLFESNQFSTLYNTDYPNSLLGLQLTLPLFQGMNRIQNMSKAKLQFQRLELGKDYLKSQINTEYTQALAAYKSNLNQMRIAKNNIVLAKDIFNTVKLQYDRGVKAYLEVIVSETDLRTAEFTYLNILFQVLTSKMDLEKALGIINLK